MMGCLFGCFRASGRGGEVKGGGGDGGHPAPPSLAPAASHQDAAGRRTRPPSRNALSAVFLREDEGSRAEQTASSWADQRSERKVTDQEVEPKAIIQTCCGALLEITNEMERTPKNADSVQQKETHSGCLPAMFDDLHLMEALKVEKCETPSRSHQSSTVPDAMSSSKRNDELQASAAPHANNMEELTYENNTEACAQDEEYQALDPADLKECGVSKEDFCQPEQSEADPKCANNDTMVSMEISISDECSLFQSSEGSVSSSCKIRDMNTASVENSLRTEADILATRKKAPKNNSTELDLPSLSDWLKPPNPKKTFRDEALIGDRSHSAKSSDEDRPIIGMVAAHWKDKEPANFAPKWWDGNGIPNSTNKYKEDQKVSWHATPFEERLEKALSEEKLLSERNCLSGKTSQLLGVEGEESDTAESNRLYAAAYA